jgi:hypothetical protein
VVPAVLDRNVFRPLTGRPLAISFKAPGDGFVTVRVFNVYGEKVREPYAQTLRAGQWVQATWDGRNAEGQGVGAGIYIVSVQGAGLRSLLKVVLIK